jgi:17beta-estradiol 17-dehydrogenase/3alpha(17beta)-hydroxysteroid dehydrogenase (NAD+)
LTPKLSVIGAGSGIGRCTAKILAQNGATIIATDHHFENAQETVKSLGDGDHIAYHMNVTNCDSVIKTLDDIVTRYKRPPKILVNCAGITRDNFIMNMKEREFEEVLTVNLKVRNLPSEKILLHIFESLFYRVPGL